MSVSSEEADRRVSLLAEYEANGGDETRDAIVESFTPLAEFFAKRYSNRSVEYDDLRQVALFGLVKCVERFDSSHGASFATFAGRSIDGEIKRWFRDKSWSVRVPRSIKENVEAVTKAQSKLERSSGTSPTSKEIADASGLDLDLVIEALDARSNYRPAQLDKPGGADGSATLGEGLVSGDDATASVDLRLLINRALNELSERERTVVSLRFFDELSQQQIAEQVGLSQMQVSRLLRKTLGTLQANLGRSDEME